jgi:hypothetical protein
MGVIPIGSSLFEFEFVGEYLPGRDAPEADARNAIHLEWENNPVPMYGGVF